MKRLKGKMFDHEDIFNGNKQLLVANKYFKKWKLFQKFEWFAETCISDLQKKETSLKWSFSSGNLTTD